MPIYTSMIANFNNFKQKLNTDKNFDIVYRDFLICERPSCMFFIDGFVKDDSLARLFEAFKKIDKSALTTPEVFSAKCIPFCDVKIENKEEKLITGILSGRIAIFIEGFDKAIEVDIRTYPQRTTAEPEKEKVMRGSKDGFTETLVLNTALLRRRIRTPDFCVAHFEIGSQSKTDVALCYIDGKAEGKIVNRLTTILNSIKTNSLTMNQQTLADIIMKKHWLNPFPKFRYSERVDTVTAQILEGDIVIMVDNAPSAMIVPTSFFDMMEEANDYYFPPVTGTYLRLTRYLIVLLTTIVTPLWLLLLKNPTWIPPWLEFIKLSEAANIPVFFQLLILEIAIDVLRLAALNTPSMMTTTLSIIGGIVLGDYAVTTGWFSAECLLYMAFVAIANFSLPSYELTYALKFMRIITLILTAFFSIWGFIAGVIINILSIALNKTVGGYSYLYPLIPFNGKKLLEKFVRIRKV
ncbi:MAG: spore germination protein [Clostridiales bacterium]|nr:MAG: spore germination protein [Clostridiales bacterium]